MTEKRFKETENGFIVDEKDKTVLNLYDTLDLLNEQNETITEQSIQLDFLQDENQHMRTVLEENRRLKQTLKDLGIEVI